MFRVPLLQCWLVTDGAIAFSIAVAHLKVPLTLKCWQCQAYILVAIKKVSTILHSNSAQCTCLTGVGSTESLIFAWLIIDCLIDHQKQCSHPILLCLSNLTLLDFAVNKYLLKSPPLQFTFILCGFNLNFYFSFNFQLALTLNVSKKGFDPCKFNLSFHGSLKMLQRATPPNFTNLVCSKSGVGSLFCSWGEESNNYVRLVNIM